jgi:nicotinamide-nucleotide amidase
LVVRAEILSVGTEFLLGDSSDTNGAAAAKELSKIGIRTDRRTSVGDDLEALKAALAEAASRSEIVLTIGGLGPTPDDPTRLAVAEWAGLELREDRAARERIEEFLRRRNRKPPEGVFAQAELPQGAEAIPNDVGTAPGVYLKVGDTIVASLPGPPSECVPMLRGELIPRLRRDLGGQERVIVSRVLHTAGVPEMVLMDEIGDLLTDQDPTVVLLASPGTVKIKITTTQDSEKEADRTIAQVEQKIRDRVGSHIFGVDEETLEKRVIEELIEHRATAASAESITGGLVSSRLTDVPGSSKAFLGGVCGYTELTKKGILGIPAAQLEEHGAVSEQVTREMAQAIRKITGADYGIATTGLAGPTRNGSEYPVGTCFISLSRSGGTVCEEHFFAGSRKDVKWRASQSALVALWRGLQEARRQG